MANIFYYLYEKNANFWFKGSGTCYCTTSFHATAFSFYPHHLGNKFMHNDPSRNNEAGRQFLTYSLLFTLFLITGEEKTQIFVI